MTPPVEKKKLKFVLSMNQEQTAPPTVTFYPAILFQVRMTCFGISYGKNLTLHIESFAPF